MEELEPGEEQELGEDLRSLREELRDLLSASRDASRPVDLDEPIGRLSRVDAMQQQRMSVANREALRLRAQQVEAALRRFEAAEYGECLGCGEPIGYRRLKARPESSLCVDCQGRSEGRR